jgi:hypothetical protein
MRGKKKLPICAGDPFDRKSLTFSGSFLEQTLVITGRVDVIKKLFRAGQV